MKKFKNPVSPFDAPDPFMTFDQQTVSKQMKPIRERLRRAERILEKSPHLYELLKQEHELEKKARARYKERGR